MIAPRGLTIHRLHVTDASRSGSLAPRLAVERLLGSADLQPAIMPPSAILVVRRLRDPQPGRIATGMGAVHVRREWEAQARRQLADHYTTAARPAWGLVAASAGAVCFADESEMLACLARDSLQSAALQQWWWRSIVRSLGGARAATTPDAVVEVVVEQLAQHAAVIPAVMARLQAWGMAAPFVRRLTTPQATRSLQALIQAYKLPALPEASDLPRSAPHPPWRAAFVPPNLGRTHAALLGLALDLSQQPYEVQRPKYWRTLRAWWQGAASLRLPDSDTALAGATHSPPGAPTVEPAVIERAKHVAPDAPPDHPDPLVQSSAVTQSPPSARGEDSSGSTSASGSNPAPQERAEGAPKPEALHNSPPAQPPPLAPAQPTAQDTPAQPTPDTPHLDVAAAATAASDAPTRDAPAPDAAADASPLSPQPTWESTLWPAAGISTRLGGLFYLVNVMAALGLPACFDAQWRLGSVGSWGLLEVLARELLGDAGSESAGDPLWAVLARLDGRPPGQAVGYRLPSTRPRRWPTFKVPEAWFAMLPPPARAAFASGNRYARWQPSGHYAPLLARWLACAMPYIDQRLRQALNLDHDTLNHGTLDHGTMVAAILLYLPSTVYITAMHIDLVTSIENIAFAVRMAGLDRDPGWQPDFGRVFYFHFE